MKTMKTITAVALFLSTFGSYTYAHYNVLDKADGISAEVKEEPFFRKAGDKLFLNFFNRGMGDIQIRVVDSENRILYSETLKSTLLVEKAFNFGRAEKDSYKVIIRNGDDTYAEYYVVK